MTVAELIEKLKALPQDLPVRYLDYEQGDLPVERVGTDFDHYTRSNGSPVTYKGVSIRPEKPTAVWIG